MKLTSTLIASLLYCSLFAQNKSEDGKISLPGNYLQNVDKKVAGLDKELTKQSERYLNKLARQEDQILQRLTEFDSSASIHFLKNTNQSYNNLSEKIKKTNGKIAQSFSGQYLPNLDSLQGSLKFIKEAKTLVSKSKDIQQQVDNSLEGVTQLQNKLKEADNIKFLVQQRQQQLKDLLSKYTALPKDISKAFGKYQQNVFYYGRHLQEFKEVLNDPDKLLKKVLSSLHLVPGFKQFMAKHSFLSGMFGSGVTPGNAAVIDPTLPTRNQVMQMVQQRVGAGGPGGQQAFSQQLQEAQSELAKLKDKLGAAGISPGGDLNMPDFKPNSLKTKSFLRRIELGANVQSNRATNYFPVTTDFAFTAGYKITPSSVLGLGISGRMGWGNSWKHIKITGEGMGLRLFVDRKAKRNFWLTGGAEMNYHKPIRQLEDFKNYSSWNKSALIGISRKYKVGKKVNGNMQVLYNLLHSRNVPRTTPIIWRVGYNF